jgi:hypothetical protein
VNQNEKNQKRIVYQKKLKELTGLNEIIYISIKACCGITESSKGAILLLDESSEYMIVKSVYNMPVEAKKFRWKFGDHPQWYQRDYFIVNDLTKEASSDKDFLKLCGNRTALVFPLKTIKKVIGSIQVYNKDCYNEEDVVILRLFAPYIVNSYIKVKGSINII